MQNANFFGNRVVKKTALKPSLLYTLKLVY